MEAEFWHSRWRENRIGFHLSEVNPLLQTHFDGYRIPRGSTFFVPLCGKTLDIGWLLGRGMKVVGCELNRDAIDALFEELEVHPEVSSLGDFVCYESDGLKVFVGDFFNLDSEIIGAIDWVYDRAAFVALPPEMRQRYHRRLIQLSKNAPQILITLCYQEGLAEGPPFRITPEIVSDAYGNDFSVAKVDSFEFENGLKGKFPATETLWHLEK